MGRAFLACSGHFPADRAQAARDNRKRNARPAAGLGAGPAAAKISATAAQPLRCRLVVASPLFGEKARGDRSLERGKLTHRMLQILPDMPAPEREAAATRYLERAARFWPAAERQSLAASVLSVLSHPELVAVFLSEARAEVAVMGTVRINDQEYAVSGRMDRLAVEDDRVILVDFKTNRVPPVNAAGVSLAHKAQLAIYREILKPLYPDKHFDCVLVYTEGASLIRLSREDLDASLAALKTK